MICVTRKYSVENYVFFFDKVVVLGFDLVSLFLIAAMFD